MPQPPAFARTANYTEYAAAHPSAPFPPSSLDTEMNAAVTTVAAIRANLVLLQRDDGSLANGLVTPDALSSAALAVAGGSWLPRGSWLTATAYHVSDVVEQSGGSYVCAVAHTSGTFATDHTAGKWVVIGGAAVGSIAASSVSYTPAGAVAATDVQAASTELDTEKATLAGVSKQAFSVATATGPAHATTAAQVQNGSLWYAAATGTGDAMLATIATAGITALVPGLEVRVKAPGASATTGPTLDLTLGATDTGAIVIKDQMGGALLAAAVGGAGHMLTLRFNGTNWLLLNPSLAAASGTVTTISVVNANGVTATIANATTTPALTIALGAITPTSVNGLVLTTTNSTLTVASGKTVTVSNTLTVTANDGATLAVGAGGTLAAGAFKSGPNYAQIATHTVSGTEATISFTGISSEDIIIYTNGLKGDGSDSLQVAVSIDNGSTYGTPRDISAGGTIGGTAIYGSAFATGLKSGHVLIVCGKPSTTAPGINSGANLTAVANSFTQFTPAAQVNALQFSQVGGSNFTLGTLTLMGR